MNNKNLPEIKIVSGAFLLEKGVNTMNLDLIKLYPNHKDIDFFESVNNEAFPEIERMSFQEAFELSSMTDTDVIGFYENGNPIGFSVLVKNDMCGYIYFLAIDSNKRSMGYGSAALQKLIDTYSDIQLILDFEELDPKAENINQRIARKKFYLRNGFYETGKFTILSGVRFEVVCANKNLKEEDLMDLIHLMHKHNPEFLDKLI